jgi:CRP-like cAMP-binding protein
MTTRRAPRAGAHPTLRAHDIATLRAGVARIHPVDDDVAFAACVVACRVRVLAKGEYFLRGGEPATQAGLLVSGLLREHFVLTNGTERTKAFVRAGEPTGSLADLLSGQVSRSYIVAEESSRLISVPFAHMRALEARFPAWRAYGERLTQLVLLRKAEREYELLGLDAAGRYRVFLQKFPGLSECVTDRHIASYLGITPVHLSRLRKNARGRGAWRVGAAAVRDVATSLR